MNSWIENEMKHMEMQQKILSEEPYSPMKHFLFDLPEMLSFLFKWFLILLMAEMVLSAMALAVAQTMVEAAKTL